MVGEKLDGGGQSGELDHVASSGIASNGQPLANAHSSIIQCASFWKTCPFPSLQWRNGDAKDESCVISVEIMQKDQQDQKMRSYLIVNQRRPRTPLTPTSGCTSMGSAWQ